MTDPHTRCETIAAPIRGSSVEVLLPVGRDPPGGTRRGLVERMVSRRGELRSLGVLLRRVIPEPVLARLVALDDWMPGFEGVSAGVL